MTDFYKLLSKLNELQEGTEEAVPLAPVATDLGGAGASDEGIDECGGDMDQGGDDTQITMSMQDLIALVHGLQKGEVDGNDQSLFGNDAVGEEYGNSAPDSTGEFTAGVDAVTPTGDDLASKGEERPKMNGGGNPMQEALVKDLHALYARIKEGK